MNQLQIPFGAYKFDWCCHSVSMCCVWTWRTGNFAIPSNSVLVYASQTCSLDFVFAGKGGLRNALSRNSDTAVLPAFQGQLFQLHSHRLLQFASHLHISNSNNELLIHLQESTEGSFSLTSISILHTVTSSEFGLGCHVLSPKTSSKIPCSKLVTTLDIT